MTRSSYVVESNAIPGCENEYNEWYDTAHLPDAIAVPGVLSVERFRVTSRFGDYRYGYVAIYDLGDQPGNALPKLPQAIRTTSPSTTAMASVRSAVALTSMTALP